MTEQVEERAAAPEGDDDTVYAVTPRLVRDTVRALEADEPELVHALLDDLHVADAADLICQLTRPLRAELVRTLGGVPKPEILTFLSDWVRADVIQHIPPARLAEMLADLATDDALFLVEDLDDETRERVLAHVPPIDRAMLEEGLGFPEESAGRLMQRDLVAVPAFWTVGQTIDYMRETHDLPDDFYDVVVVDPQRKVVGAVRLDRLLRTRRPVAIGAIMNRAPIVVPVDTPREDVAHIFRQYDLVASPVIDGAQRLVGVITIDDVVDVIEEEAEEDLLRLSGVVEEDTDEPVLRTTRLRFTWLLVNLFTAIAASLVIGLFDAAIEQVVALAVLMPIVASMGGNAGTQTLTVAVRALATRSLTPSNAVRIVIKEVLVGGLNGIVFAVLVGIAAIVWFGDPVLGAVIGVAMVINLLVAGLSGIAIPLILDKMGVDPAVSGTVFLTTVTDVVGFFAFLGLGYVFLVA